MSLARRLVLRSGSLAVGRPAHQRWTRSWEDSTSSGSDVGARLKKWYKKRREGCDLKSSFSDHLQEHERGISHSERIIVPFTKEQLYCVVADVGSYPQFTPWVLSANIFGQNPNSPQSANSIPFFNDSPKSVQVPVHHTPKHHEHSHLHPHHHHHSHHHHSGHDTKVVHAHNPVIRTSTGSVIDLSKPQVFWATLSVGFKTFSTQYTSCVTTQPYSSVKASVTDSAVLDYLVSSWSLQDDPNKDAGCIVDFNVSFRFRSALMHSVAHTYFSLAHTKMVSAFIERCMTVYPSHRH
eukprot:TRINITY_DN2738_c0_g1_i1.p1 TRINITY_DN2738_c0_g1~~TRINITY_DN2738_c0_g1_i1.p1  ORF type:complete len:294 (+),score=55.27 TRINITY_DN2738_c0_g1_i1:68-949(+)